MKVKVFVVLLFLVFVGCNESKDWQEYEVVFSDEVEKSPLVSTKIEEVIRPDFISKVGDRIFVLSSVSDEMVFEYDLDMSLLRNWGRKGQGPNEVSNFLMFCKGDSLDQSLYLWGMSPTAITQYLKNGEGVFEKIKNIDLPYYSAFNSMNLSEGLHFYYFDVNELLVKKIDLNSGEEKSVGFEKDKDDRSSAFFANRGVMDVNDDYIVYAYMYKNEIDIYDKKDLSHLKKYKLEKNGFKTDKYNLTRYYTNVVVSNKYIYAYRVDSERRHLIEVYDFNGNAIVKNVLDIPVPLFTVDEERGLIIGFNYNDEDFVYTYDSGLINADS